MPNPWPSLVWPKVTMPIKGGFALGEISLIAAPNNPFPKTNFAIYFLEAQKRADSEKRT
ncbi:Hypothetical protein KNT65_gp226 [Escherichia phage EcS1]|uniref:Uncharacterized protein n=1 Tax=Escherichia phage EcS1 TaxID=2083276 RepID=A0A2Z5ZCQ3_9CAUD|nr:Hypothetical protein KNT65_gp226 [Escherichia phage EcS1]BBC78267.1 Hypothetical protein [Escherichia phage EcS1]